jgi:hypothetical protein
MNQQSRHDALRDLVQLRGDLHALIAELHQFSWAYSTELVELTTADARGVLRRYLAGELRQPTAKRGPMHSKAARICASARRPRVCWQTWCSSWRIRS